jgi:hypothetical protein
MVQEQIDAWARHQRREALQQLLRGEHEVRRPVGPRALQRQRHAPIAQPLQAPLPDRWTAEIAAELFEALSIAGCHVDGRVEVEPLGLGVERDVSVAPRRVGVATDSQRPRPARRPNAARPSTAACVSPASAADSSAKGSVSASVVAHPTIPRRSSRRRTRATTHSTSASVGAAAG